MDKENLFRRLERQNKQTLLDLLQVVYDKMNVTERKAIFGQFEEKQQAKIIDGDKTLKEIKKFYDDSMKGVYYAPFTINSKNFSHVPEETDEWFERVGYFLAISSQLSNKGKHSIAAECFNILYKLIDTMESGEEIVFAHELGSWMIPGGEKDSIKAYVSSLAAIKSPEEFTDTIIPLVRRDSCVSNYNKVYSTAISAANKEQKDLLKNEIKCQNIRTK